MATLAGSSRRSRSFVPWSAAALACVCACGQSAGPADASDDRRDVALDAPDATAERDTGTVGASDAAAADTTDATFDVVNHDDGVDVTMDATDAAADVTSADASADAGAHAGLVWHPGNYLKLISGTASERDTFLRSSIAAQFVGIENRYDWSTAETAMGDYSAGLAAIDADLAAVDAAGKTLLIYLPYKHFNASGPGEAVPHYMTLPGPWCVTATGTTTSVCGQFTMGTGTTSMGNGTTAMIWVPAVAQRYIAWVRAVAAHVGPSHPHARALAGIVYPETASMDGATIHLADVGYTQDTYLAGIESYLTVSAQVFPRHPSFLHINFFPPNGTASTYLTRLATFALAHPNVGLGCPDVATMINPPGYAILRNAMDQQRLPFDVEIQAMDYRPDLNADVASAFRLASAPAPNGFYAAFVTWVNVRNASGNAFTIDDVAAYLQSHSLPHTAPPTY